MSDTKWTESQLDAINARDGSILVSAAAGSGKTAVLVERVIKTITDEENPIPVDRLLIVTFTRAASQEMRSRIDDALNSLLEKDPYNENLLFQKKRLYNAKISTIDSFCSDFVRQYFYKLNIQNDFRIADANELELLKEKALDKVLRNAYDSESLDFYQLVDAVCSYRDDKDLRNYILKIYNFVTSIPFMDTWFEKAKDLYDNEITPVSKAPYVINILKEVSESLNHCEFLLRRTKELVENDNSLEEKHQDKFRDLFANDLSIITDIKEKADNGDWNGVFQYNLDGIDFKNLITVRGWDVNKKTEVKNMRESYKKICKEAVALVYENLKYIEVENEKLYPVICALLDCVADFNKEFSALKREKNIADFSDIENLMIELLCKNTEEGIVPTDIAKEISSMFDYVMVDEFQDVNDVQNLLFRALSRNGENLFIVGDVKQSIYGFRQAKPEIFIDYKDKYNLYSREKNNYPGKIILDKNFRSCKGIIEACNFIFENIMSKEVGGISYNQEERLVCGATYYPDTTQPALEIDLINSHVKNEEENETNDKLEAQHIALKIYKMIFEDKIQISDKGTLRPAQFGDMAILLRTAKGQANRAVTYMNVLNDLGIMATSSEKNSFFDIYEIRIMLNLLKIIDNPLQDIPLLSVMLSPIGSFNADYVARLRCENKVDLLYNAVLADSKTNSDSKRFIDFISELRKVSVTTPVDKLIGLILQKTSFDSIVKALNGSSDNYITGSAIKNINLLQEYARDYNKNGYKTLSAFINYIDRVQEKGLKIDASSNSLGENTNAVKIMSIHASKGLEFPIVFLASANAKFNEKDASEQLLVNSEYGISIKYNNDKFKYDTIQRKYGSIVMKNSFVSEEMRILYVALTRAKEKLIITSALKDPMSLINKMASTINKGQISPYTIKTSDSIMKWLVSVALIHPSCNEWRELSNYDTQPVNNPDLIPWKFNIIDQEQFDEIRDYLKNFPQNNSPKENTPEVAQEPNYDFLNSVKEKINFLYPDRLLTTLPQKISASDLVHKDNKAFEKVLQTPSFITDKKVKPTDRGTAFHKFMEHCDFKQAQTNPEKQAEILVNSGYLTEEYYNLLDFDKIRECLNSPLFNRVVNSKECYREFMFNVKINGVDYDPNIDPSLRQHKILMRGAVDLSFVENDELVLVDYKTDRVKDINSLLELYSKQLYLYKNAMEQCTDYKVKEMYIFSVHLNKAIKLTL